MLNSFKADDKIKLVFKLQRSHISYDERKPVIAIVSIGKCNRFF